MTKSKAKPVPQLSAAEIAAATAQWDTARAELEAAGDAAAAAQLALDGLAQDASAEDRQAALDLLSATRERVLAVQTSIDGLKPPAPADVQVAAQLLVDQAFLAELDGLCAKLFIERDAVLGQLQLALTAQTLAAAASGPRQVLRVLARQPSRWRAKREFTPAPTDILLTDLTEDERAEIEADPALAVSVETVGD